MRSDRLTKLRGPLLGLGVLALTGATALAADGSLNGAYQTAALDHAATAVMSGKRATSGPESFVIDSSGDTAAMFGIMAAILDLQPARISVTQLGAGADSDLHRASAVRDWLVALGFDESRISIAGRDAASAEAATRDGAVQITLVE